MQSKIYIPDLLRPSEVKHLLETLNISWYDRKVNARGWVRIQSPFRKDMNPSFSLNVQKGCFKDFANPEIKGDIIHLVMYAKGYKRLKAEQWVINTLNLNTKINFNI